MTLVQDLARPAPARTPYTEVRFAKLLDGALIVHGQMAWLGGDRLERSVTGPGAETINIDGNHATLQRAGQPALQLPLDRAPGLKDLLGSFVALLSGDAAALARSFELQAYGNDQAWTLELQPRAAQVRQHIRAITVDGSDRQMRCMRVDSTSGATTFTLLGALADARLPAAPTPAQMVRLCAGP